MLIRVKKLASVNAIQRLSLFLTMLIYMSIFGALLRLLIAYERKGTC